MLFIDSMEFFIMFGKKFRFSAADQGSPYMVRSCRKRVVLPELPAPSSTMRLLGLLGLFVAGKGLTSYNASWSCFGDEQHTPICFDALWKSFVSLFMRLGVTAAFLFMDCSVFLLDWGWCFPFFELCTKRTVSNSCSRWNFRAFGSGDQHWT